MSQHSETITPHGNNPTQYQQGQSGQSPHMPVTLSNTSSTSSSPSSYLNQGPPHSGTQMGPHSGTQMGPYPGTQMGPYPGAQMFPYSSTQMPNPGLQATIEQQQYLRPHYPFPQIFQTNPPSPNMQSQVQQIYQMRPQDKSQAPVPVLLATLPQMPGATGEQPVTFIMQTLPLSNPSSFSFPKSEDLPKPVNWMSETRIQLDEIPILGSNNSGFFMGENRAQRVDVAEQLKFGMRFLDLAIVQYHDEIYLDQYRHIFDLQCPYISISEALWSIRFFLERNSGEIIFLNLRSNSTSKAGENSDTIDPDLLEAKFRFIKKFIFEINEINFNLTPGELTSLTKRNIICFTENTEHFSFLSKKNLSFSSNQIEIIPFLNYDIGDELKKSWNKPRKRNANILPQNMRFIWYIIDAVTPNSDAELFRSTWEKQLIDHMPPPFHFYSLCKVNKHTWENFNSLMLCKQPPTKAT